MESIKKIKVIFAEFIMKANSQLKSLLAKFSALMVPYWKKQKAKIDSRFKPLIDKVPHIELGVWQRRALWTSSFVVVFTLLIGLTYFSVPGQLLYTLKSTVEAQRLERLSGDEQLEWLVNKNNQLLATWEQAVREDDCTQKVIVWQELRKNWKSLVLHTPKDPYPNSYPSSYPNSYTASELDVLLVEMPALSSTSDCGQEFYFPEYAMQLEAAGFQLPQQQISDWQETLTQELADTVEVMQTLEFTSQEQVEGVTELLIGATEIAEKSTLALLYKQYLLINQAKELEHVTAENTTPEYIYNYQALAWLSCQIDDKDLEKCESTVFDANWNSILLTNSISTESIKRGEELYQSDYVN